MILSAIAGIGISIWSAIDFYYDNKLYHIIIVSIPILIFCISVIPLTLWHKIILTDKTLEQSSYRHIIIPFEKVDHIKLYDNQLIVLSGKKKIKITSDLQDQQMLIEKIVSKVRENEGLKVSGSRSAIEKYLSP